MRRVILFTILAVFLSFFNSLSVARSADRLVTINGIEYTNDDFRNWWKLWNDKNKLEFPSSPDEFITFQLMAQQGLDMGYDSQPNYIHKLNVFLQVRAMMALKYEEIDSKVKVTDNDLNKYFEQNFAKVFVLQILAFDKETKAQKAYDSMMPFDGKSSGQLAFADLIGGDVSEKPDTYDEVKVSVADFHNNKKDSWLAVVRKMKVNGISKPFLNEDNKKYILLRLAEIKPAKEGLFEEKRPKMTEIIYKDKRDQLTIKFLEKLKKKYNVLVDRDLLNTVKLDQDYPEDFLERRVVLMKDISVTVRDLINNCIKEKKLRKDIPDELIKNIVLDTIISQTLINQESLSRGYEKRQPLKPIYEFYKKNRLRAEVEKGLMHDISITDQEVQDYYDTNLSAYTVQEKVTFSIVKGEEETIKKIWVGLLQGGDFDDLAKKYSLEATTQTLDTVSLPQKISGELQKLGNGEVTLPFQHDGKYSLIKIVERYPGQVTPIDQVKAQIAEQLKKEKFDAIKVDYINKLKSRSKIEVKEEVWKALERELSNAKKD